MTDRTVFAILLLLWVALSTLGGALLALLARRIHPGLSLKRLWLFYTALLAATVAIVLAIVWR